MAFDVNVNLPKSTEAELNDTLKAAREEIERIADTRRKLDAALNEYTRLAEGVRLIVDVLGVGLKARQP